jgi:hypothetical protein
MSWAWPRSIPEIRLRSPDPITPLAARALDAGEVGLAREHLPRQGATRHLLPQVESMRALPECIRVGILKRRIEAKRPHFEDFDSDHVREQISWHGRNQTD